MASGARFSSPVLVERDEELARLDGVLSDPPSLAIVEGEAGVGKSRLVQEALRNRPGPIALSGQCRPLSEPLPLGPLIHALRAAGSLIDTIRLTPLAGALRPLLPEMSDVLPPAPPPLGDANAERHRVFRAIAELLRAIGPCVLLVEDVHWSDATSLDCIQFLLAEAIPTLTIVVTYRGEEAEPAPLLQAAARPPSDLSVERITLAPLSGRGVGELTSGILDGQPVSEEFAAFLHERTDGIPFAVEEVLRLLMEQGDVVHDGARWTRKQLGELRVPSALRDSILQRLHRLGPDAAALVEAAAVLRSPADQDLLSSVAGLPTPGDVETLVAAMESGLLRERAPGSYGPRHSIAGQVVYGAIPAPRRAAMHREAGRALEKVTPPPLDDLTLHFREAGCTAEWVRYAEAAARVAASVGDEVRAAQFLRDALGARGLSSDARAKLARKLGAVALGGLAQDWGVDLLREVVDKGSLPPGVRGEIRLWLAWLLYQSGDAAGWYDETVRCLEELRRRPRLQIEAISALCLPYVVGPRLDDHLGWMEQARALAETVRDPRADAVVDLDRATLLLAVGHREAAAAVERLPGRPRSREDSRMLLRTYLNLANAALDIGSDRLARDLLDRCRTIRESLPHAGIETSIDSAELRADRARGNWIALEERARLFAEEADVPLTAMEAELVLGILALAKGDKAAATERLHALLEPAERHGMIPLMSAAAGRIAATRLHEGNPDAALASTHRVLDIVRGKGIWAWAGECLSVATEAMLQLNRHDDARSLVREATARLRGFDAPLTAAAVALSAGLVAHAAGDSPNALRLLSKAERAWERMPRPYEGALTRERRGQVLAAVDPSRSVRVFEDAAAAFETLGAGWDASRVRRRIRSLGFAAPQPWRGGRRGYGDALSPREEDVVRLASGGRTNREIATELFLSERTVANHMASVLRKLGLSSRRELTNATAG